MRMIVLVLGLLLTVVAPALASLQITVHDPQYHVTVSDLAEDVHIDWIAGAITVTSQARSPLASHGALAREAACKEALVRAKGQLKTALGGMKLTSYATVGEMLRCRILPVEAMDNICENLRMAASGWDEEMQRITLVSVLPFLGPNTPAELSARMLKLEQQALAEGDKPPLHAIDKRRLRPRTVVKQLSAGPYNGLVIDCRGLRYTPLLLSKLLAPDGTEIWPLGKINTLMVMEKGWLGYYATLKDALTSTRVGDAPYLVTPLGVAGDLHGDLVLSPEDIQVLQSKNTDGNLLTNQSVALLID